MRNEQDLVSLGRLANRLGVKTSEVLRASRDLNLRPVLWLDESPYWPAEDVEPMRKALQHGIQS